MACESQKAQAKQAVKAWVKAESKYAKAARSAGVKLPTLVWGVKEVRIEQGPPPSNKQLGRLFTMLKQTAAQAHAAIDELHRCRQSIPHYPEVRYASPPWVKDDDKW